MILYYSMNVSVVKIFYKGSIYHVGINFNVY